MSPPAPDTSPEDKLEAALEVIECMRVLGKSGQDLVKEVLQGQDFVQWRQYPQEKGVYDAESHAQYFFHAHEASWDEWDDYGHFHTFIRLPGITSEMQAVDTNTSDLPPEQVIEATHLVGISLDNQGQPVRLFTTNRWVTAETWYGGEDVIALLDQFEIDLAKPSWPLNRWLTAMLVLYRDEIEELIRQRDVVISAWSEDHPDTNVYEDRELAVTSALVINLGAKLSAVSEILP